MNQKEIIDVIISFLFPIAVGSLIGGGIYAWFELHSYVHAGLQFGIAIICLPFMILSWRKSK